MPGNVRAGKLHKADDFPSLQTNLCVCLSVRRFRCAQPRGYYIRYATRPSDEVMAGKGSVHAVGAVGTQL